MADAARISAVPRRSIVTPLARAIRRYWSLDVRHDRCVAKFRCTCGEQVSTSGGIPNRQEWHLIADADFDVDEDATTLLGRSIHAWRCQRCGRLWVESGRVLDGDRQDTLWEFVPAFDSPGPLAPRD